jgi:hypothetical protein
VRLDIRVVSPHDCIDPMSQIVEEQPNTKERDGEIPGLTNEAVSEDEEHEKRRAYAKDGVKWVRGIDGHFAYVRVSNTQ